MACEFVPFVAAARSASGKPAGASVDEFTALAVPPAQASPALDSAPVSAHSAPDVTLKRDGDRVTQIQIRCACGAVIELDCTY